MKSSARRLLPDLATAIILVVAAVLGLLGMDRLQPLADTAFYTEPARVLASEGRWASPMFAGVRDLDAHFFLQPPLSFLERAAFFKVFGCGPLTVHLAALVEYLIAIWLLSLVLRETLADSRHAQWLGACATALFAFDARVVEYVREARPDYLAVSLALASVLLLVRARRDGQQGPRLAAAAGVLLGAAGVAHTLFLAAAPLAAIAVVIPLADEHEPWGRRWPRLLVWGVGFAIPLCGWGLMISGAPHAFAEQFLPHVSGAVGYIAPGSGIDDSVKGRLFDKVRNFSRMPLGGLAVLLLTPNLLRLRGVARIPALYLATWFLLLLSAQNFTRMMAPFIYAGCALSLDQALQEGWLNGRWRAARAAAAIVVLSYVPMPALHAIATAVQPAGQSERAMLDWVRERVPEGVPVIGVPADYFAVLGNHDRFFYPAPLAWITFPPTQGDVDVFESRLNALRPPFALLAPETDLHQLDFLRGATLDRVASFDPPIRRLGPLMISSRRLVLWKISYKESPG